MAHKGKAYPVGIRRDFNINVLNNSAGWANRYIVALNRLPPGIGHILQDTSWDCGPEGTDPPDRLFWGSDPEFHGPFVYDVILTAAIVDNREFTKRCEIREAISGTILRLVLINDPQPWYPNFPQFQTWATIFRDPFFFTADGFANQVQPTPKLWTDPPPH